MGYGKGYLPPCGPARPAYPRNDKLADLPVIMGIIHVREGRDADALAQFQTARRLASTAPDVEFQTEAICALELGRLLVKKGDRAAALEIFERALHFDSREICYETAMLLDKKEDERRRRALLHRAAVTGHVDAIRPWRRWSPRRMRRRWLRGVRVRRRRGICWMR